MLLRGGAIRESAGAFEDHINTERIPRQGRHLGLMTQWHQQLIDGQQITGAGNASGVTAVIGVIARQVDNGVGIGDLINRGERQLGLCVWPTVIDPQ